MSWWGKVVGGAFGYMLGGPLGALIGGALGHKVDQAVKGFAGYAGRFEPGAQERVQTAFFTATFSVMGHVAKADGRVSKDEISFAKAIMAQMRLAPEMRKVAIKLFSKGKQADFRLEEVIEQFRRECHGRHTLMQMFIEIQLQAAYADGKLDKAERQLLISICNLLGFPLQAFSRIEAMIRASRHYTGGAAQPPPQKGPSLHDAYAILNITSKASDAEVKRAYRRLMSQHHPDKLVSKGLPEEMMEIAKQKTQEIRKAYEKIKEARDL